MSLSARRRLVNSREDCTAEVQHSQNDPFDICSIFKDHKKQATRTRKEARHRVRRRRKVSVFASMTGEMEFFRIIIAGGIVVRLLRIHTLKTLFDQVVALADSALAAPSSIKASKPTYRVNTDAPAWRIVAGNIAAGATAGAVVEAGTSHAPAVLLVTELLHECSCTIWLFQCL